MNVLMIYPPIGGALTYGVKDPALKMAGKHEYLPPLGLITVAALLPRDWRIRLVDLSFQRVSDEMWKEADLVMASGTIVQLPALLDLVKEAKQRNKRIVIGGPGVFHYPDEPLKAGADFVVKGEAETAMDILLERLRTGGGGGLIEANGHADLTQSAAPRYDLLDMSAYADMSIQFSRGCRYHCEFCDVTHVFGREVRIKKPQQVINELEALYKTGWRRRVLFVDDNFIGRPVQAKRLLDAMIEWMDARGRPFEFITFASVNLGMQGDLADRMVRAGFTGVLLGIETTDLDSLTTAGKLQNVAIDVERSCLHIQRAGLQIVALTMMGFDGEKPDRDKRVIDFITRTNIGEVDISILQAFPGTLLWTRMKSEHRLLADSPLLEGDWHDMAMNFAPQRPLEEIYSEFVNVLQTLYEPGRFMQRALNELMNMKPPTMREPFRLPYPYELRLFAKIVIQWGVRSSMRGLFWKLLGRAVLKLPKNRFDLFIRMLVLLEHYLEFAATSARTLERVRRATPDEPTTVESPPAGRAASA